MKRQSSCETPPSKVRAASSPSQQELLPSPGSSRQMVPVQQSMGRGKPVFYRLDYFFGKTPDKQASPGLCGQQARQREEQAAEERRQEAEKTGFFFVDHPLPPGIGEPDRKAARLPRKRPSNAAFGVVKFVYICMQLFDI